MDIISKAEYRRIIDSVNYWRDSGFEDALEPSDNDIQALDQYEFVNVSDPVIIVGIDPTQKYALSLNDAYLGNVYLDIGRVWRSNFGDVRIPIEMDGIDGNTYRGTFFLGSSYARLRKIKG